MACRQLEKIRDDIKRDPQPHIERFAANYRFRYYRYEERWREQKLEEKILDDPGKQDHDENQRDDHFHAKAVEGIVFPADDVMMARSPKPSVEQLARRCVQSLPHLIDVLLNNSVSVCKRFVEIHRAFFNLPPHGLLQYQNTIVTGSAGVGKTFSAAALGSAITYLGYLMPPPDIKEIKSYKEALEEVAIQEGMIKTATDLTSSYAAGSGKAVRKVFYDFMEKPFIIDEAYALAPTNSGNSSGTSRESLTEIVAYLGGANKYDSIIFALGYPADMKRFLGSNEGFKRRFRYSIKIEVDEYQFLCTFTHEMCRMGYPPNNYPREFCDRYNTKACKSRGMKKGWEGWSAKAYKFLTVSMVEHRAKAFPFGVIDGAVKLAKATAMYVSQGKAASLDICHVLKGLNDVADEAFAGDWVQKTARREGCALQSPGDLLNNNRTAGLRMKPLSPGSSWSPSPMTPLVNSVVMNIPQKQLEQIKKNLKTIQGYDSKLVTFGRKWPWMYQSGGYDDVPGFSFHPRDGKAKVMKTMEEVLDMHGMRASKSGSRSVSMSKSPSPRLSMSKSPSPRTTKTKSPSPKSPGKMDFASLKQRYAKDLIKAGQNPQTIDKMGRQRLLDALKKLGRIG
jgi:hypothetical protein